MIDEEAVGEFLEPFRRVERGGSALEINQEGAALGIEAARRLAVLGAVKIGRGLTEAELTSVERIFGFEFADDHRAFLATGLPIGLSFPDWLGAPGVLRDDLAWPVHGVLFDVEHNAYWHTSWGDRPADRPDALTTAKLHLRKVPQMVPLFGHRYLPSGRGSYGHPVLSMYQTDIIYYGRDLADYIHNEFAGPAPDSAQEPQATVAFWKDFLTERHARNSQRAARAADSIIYDTTTWIDGAFDGRPPGGRRHRRPCQWLCRY